MPSTNTQEKASRRSPPQPRWWVGTPLEGPIGYHQGRRIELPLDPDEDGLRADATVIDAAISRGGVHQLGRNYHYRPFDGAVAVNTVLRELYGQVLGKKTWFSDPQMVSVEVAAGVHRSVPWGLIQLPPTFGAKAQLSIGTGHDPIYGTVLSLAVSAIKRSEPAVSAISTSSASSTSTRSTAAKR
jgi:hypothetical protein